ncbi:MAG TPA: heparan-alpha-glucosaminide N-acetyltransferase [Methanomicrobiales archaeon]|nr:heparan-alpha-glucosaminide N-acetyltransferase [Methanomicrobiales archaeon]
MNLMVPGGRHTHAARTQGHWFNTSPARSSWRAATVSGERFWEIDALRGTAVVMMVIFHTVFAMSFLGVRDIDVVEGSWRAFALATATLFILIAGVSIAVSSARAGPALGPWRLAVKNLRRGAGIFLVGMGITAVTWIFVRDQFVIFGVLHCIGVSVALSPLFLRFGSRNLIPGAAILLLGPFVAMVNGPLPLLWLGIHPADFASLDYVPLVPWLGVFLLGMGLGATVYPEGKRAFPVRPGAGENLLARPIEFLGRHSLPIYLVHIPVILLILALVVPGLAPRMASIFLP